MGQIAGIWRYPVKSARGETLAEAEVEDGGLAGDRTWACVDDQDATIGSAKHPRRWGALLQVRASGDPAIVEVGGARYEAGSAEADKALGEHLGRPVRLTRTAPAEPRIHRLLPEEAGMVPDWLADLRPGQERVEEAGGHARTGRFVDFGAVHLVTTGALAALAEKAGHPVPAERFRPNLLIDADADPDPGTEVAIGDVLLRVLFRTPRCVIPSLPQAGLPTDPVVLRTLARHYRIDVFGNGKGACFGVYADVVRPGRLTLGAPVTPT
ncbi:molybdenum cofactor biosysynthesis protein [Actinoplanes ianthinogenes]|uniref:Molybdenum cofactor biosysynthesis protein n=1 Tax=Actinoplanes ianthinogenes TaxID=122358 RepID=A0ABN6CCI6_9ACTN|nr:MOSC domain-containing protein [Actinoplanes ianthinogenes]BCJ42109.1 molybdenum cofactor biosysynthesis protein [Actinoplanes ianthinogenes]GGR37622.1 molybdenum cofactor biosysynthesis protein [Actinoplanes ianthinogenes]